MIQKSLMNMLREEIPGLVWSADFYALEDDTGTVYSTGGPAPDEYETGVRYPTYQVYIRSSDWGYAKAAANMAFNKLHRKGRFRVTEAFEKDGQVIYEKDYYIYLITAMSDPIRIGVENNIMDYSVNFDVTLKEE